MHDDHPGSEAPAPAADAGAEPDAVTAAGPAIGFSTWAFPGRPVDHSIDYALAHGFEAMEVCLLDPALFGGALVPDETLAARALRRAESLRLSVHAPIDEVCLGEDDPRLRQAAEDTLAGAVRAAAAMGAETVVCHLNRRRGQEPDASWAPGAVAVPRAGEHLHRVAGLAAEVGVALAVENVGFEPIAIDGDPADLLRLVDELGHEAVGLTLDIGHAHVHREMCGGPAELARSMGPRLRHVHVHDNDGSADQHRALGRGDVPVADVAAHWRDLDGILTLEVFPHVDTDMEPAILASRAALDRMLPERRADR